jgi:hypothetical protein
MGKGNKKRNGKLSLRPLGFEEAVRHFLSVKCRDKSDKTVKRNEIPIRRKEGGVIHDIT